MGHWKKMYSYTVVILAICLQATTCVNVLLLPLSIKSHLMNFGTLAEVLMKHGHNVTMVVHPLMDIPKSVLDVGMHTETFIMDEVPICETPEHQKETADVGFNGSFIHVNAVINMKRVIYFTNECGALLRDTKMIHRLQEKRFNMAILDMSPCTAVIPIRLDIPYVMFGSLALSTWYRSPDMPSYVPFIWTSFTDKMTFPERLRNFAMYALLEFGFIVDESIPIYGRGRVTFTDLARGSELFFLIRETEVDFVRPRMPNVIPIGGILGKVAKPLPPDLETFVSRTNNGVIIVSFGMWLTHLPDHIVNMLISAFGQMEQRIIWKYNGTIPQKLPENVMVLNWLPQNDLLGHPNTKLFVTHAGTATFIESVYHGVPMVTIPFILDQMHNAAIARSRGYGETLTLSKTSSEEIVRTMKKVLHTPSYTQKVKMASKHMRSPAKDAGSLLDYWIRRVVQDGAADLRSAAIDMPVYAYYMLDIMAFILFILLVTLYIFFLWVKLTIRICWYYCCRKRSKSKTQ